MVEEKRDRSGLVIPVPEADGMLSTVGERYPDAVRAGVPAHVSLLYPFVPPSELDGEVVATLSALFAGWSPWSVAFHTCQRRGDFVYLEPDPREQLVELTRQVRQRWPRIVPYEGRYDVVEPHLTVATRVAESTAESVARQVPAELPVVARLKEAWLVVLEQPWRCYERFPLGIG